MSGFSIEWLNLRERPDELARNKDISTQAVAWVNIAVSPDRPEPLVVDLGAGTGATLRTLSALGVHKVVWRLVDHDGQLLDEALKRHRKSHIIEDYQADLTVVQELPLAAARLVTASALFDLVSTDFIDALVPRLQQCRNALYAALSYDGVMQWTPAHPYDKQVLDAFNQDQHRDKGFGPALGPDASDYLIAALQEAGFTVSSGSSPWLLQAADQELVSELIGGIHNAVADGYGLEKSLLDAWQQYRQEHASSGTCQVGHVDLLALPTNGGVS